ncbi:MAG: CPBP family intramembrane glutamic endopeptidase [Candidatus Nanopelagicales bacterium]
MITAPTRRDYGAEVVVVLWVSLGASAVRALLVLIDRLTAGVPLSEQQTSIVAPVTPDRPWLDLLFQVSFIVLPLGAVALVWYLLHRSGESLGAIGFDLSQPGRDVARGVVLAAVLGGLGLVFYVLAFRAGISVQIAAATTSQWWDWPLLLAQALQNAVVEEVVVLGFVVLRLTQMGMPGRWAVVISALVRATYHLYQGFGGFVGNLVMGLVFGALFLRWRRVGPMVVAHFLIDAVAFVGYALVADHVSWLPH